MLAPTLIVSHLKQVKLFKFSFECAHITNFRWWYQKRYFRDIQFDILHLVTGQQSPLLIITNMILLGLLIRFYQHDVH